VARCTTWAAAALLLTILGAAACNGGDSDESAPREESEEPAPTAESTARDETTEPEPSAGGEPTREDYAAALGEGTVGLSNADSMCFGLAIVDAVGFERLQQANAFDLMAADSDASLADMGITLDEAQTAALLDGLHQCGDMRAMFKNVLAADGTMLPEAANCVIDGLDDTLFDRLLVVSIAGGEQALNADPELVTGLQDAVLTGAQAGVG
jgi:hypothetical protein